MTGQTAILVALFAPLAGAAAIALVGRWPNLREATTLVTGVVTFAAVVSLVSGVMTGDRPEASLVEVLPGIALAFSVEPLGMVFGLIASFLWIVTSIYSIGYMRGHDEPNQTRFYAYFAIAIASALGVAFAANLFTLLVYYEVLTLSTYPLVAHAGTEEAKTGGRVYLGLLLATSIGFLLLAVAWTWNLAGTLDFRAGGILRGTASDALLSVLFVLYLFGIGKAALMPFHRWLPAAMVAPTPVSALLHAVAVVKAGVFSVLKVAVYVFGVDLVAELGSARLMGYVAGATIVIASLVALRQDNLKLRLAYSTVSQLSYIVLAATLGNAVGAIGGAMHIATHAFGKITLFFCAGAIMVASHKTRVSELDGIGRRMPVTMTAFLIGSLSIVGLPPFAGLWSKWTLALGTLEADDYLSLGVLLLSSLLSAGYLLPIVIRAFFASTTGGGDGGGIREAPLSCVVALSLTAGGCAVLFLYADPLYRLLTLMTANPG